MITLNLQLVLACNYRPIAIQAKPFFEKKQFKPLRLLQVQLSV